MHEPLHEHAVGAHPGHAGAPAPPAGRPAWARGLRVAVLAATDFAALFAAGATAWVTWARPMRGQAPDMYLALAPLLLLFVVGYGAGGLYPGFGLGPVDTLRRLSLVTGFGFLVLASITFALKLPHRYSRVTFVLALLLALLAVPLLRALIGTWAGRTRWWREPVVVAASRGSALAVIGQLDRAPLIGYQPVAVLEPGGGAAGMEIGGLPTFDLDRAEEISARGVRVALVAGLGGGTGGALLDRLQQRFRHVLVLHPYEELPVEGIQVRNLGRAVGIEYTNNLLLRRNRLLKRALDLGAGGVLLVLSLPVLAAAVLAVKLAGRGPAFFTQVRTGLDGRPIRVPKVRTMHVDAERRLAEHLAARPDLQREWQRSFKLRHDPRLIPGVGPFLRRFSLDELPQLWSVVRGDMSLVGPRPFPDYHLDRFPEAFRQLRQRVRPGITGLWQVTVRGEGTIAEQRAYDTYYIRNWSLWLDLYVLGRTLGAVVGGHGAY